MPTPAYSLDHAALLDTLAASDRLLIIQDLDGVCMDLVRDPLQRRIDRRYVEATHRLAGHFYVLTNGEHIGSRGVNSIVEQAFDRPEHVRDQGFYLPGLAAGGVQLQDRHGRVSHPGVSDEELAFLRSVPERARRFLGDLLGQPRLGLAPEEIAHLVASCVLDNPASPTVNINGLHHRFGSQPQLYGYAQREIEDFMRRLQAQAEAAGLGDSFFIHYAPNLGRDAAGEERPKPAGDGDAGTTDFQFMLKGAVKEVGVLVILNHYYHQHYGTYPLGERFNARQSPRRRAQLRALAREHFDRAKMPRIVGVGDTVTSHCQSEGGRTRWLRGGSDRGFLSLVQALGRDFDSGNLVVYIDSSRGQVRRPGVDVAALQRHHASQDPPAPWPALKGITDAADPLRFDYIIPGGFAQYVDLFCELARRRAHWPAIS